MISLILYGRNDNYGYNLHKRAALSLNCMAEVLTDADDEILFVDYNTPDDFPTFPEAIQDTLTERAQRMLRIFRARPPIQLAYQDRTHLKVIEPIARNIALRRSSPNNRWVLSTNTDMIFVPRGEQSLSDIAANLSRGLYHLPRFEIPESVWEGFNRLDPTGTIAAVHRWGYFAHLNEVVYGRPELKFDGPGDFQLVEREELFAIHGFHEDMILGWHVDANLSKRLMLRYGGIEDLLPHIFGYHCDHTRQVTPAHRVGSASNDAETFFENIAGPEIPEQAETWGCCGTEIEEIGLATSSSTIYTSMLSKVVREPMRELTEAHYTPESYNKIDYDPHHVVPFLLDIFINAPRTTNVAWFGNRQATFDLFAKGFRAAGFQGWLLLDSGFPRQVRAGEAPLVEETTRFAVLAAADAFVFDLAPVDAEGSDSSFRAAVDELLTLIARAEERRRPMGKQPRRVVALNAIHNDYEQMFCARIAAAQTPFSARLRHGFIFERDAASAATE